MRRALLLLLFVCLAVSVRDAAFWKQVLKSTCSQAKDSIIGPMSEAMNAFVQQYDMSNDRRISNFLGQCAVESAHFTTTTEFASGSGYEGRKDLGNTQSGDGRKFKGRGLIQLTGRANYKKIGDKLGQNFVANPDMVASFPWALMVSGEYWKSRSIIDSKRNSRGKRPRLKGQTLNTLADANNYSLVTFNVNGGFNHAKQREEYTKKAFAALQKDTSGAGPVGGAPPRQQQQNQQQQSAPRPTQRGPTRQERRQANRGQRQPRRSQQRQQSQQSRQSQYQQSQPQAQQQQSQQGGDWQSKGNGWFQSRSTGWWYRKGWWYKDGWYYNTRTQRWQQAAAQ